ncbi:MAG: hydantoinase/oxoprolinase family protein [Gammaproteobacteria bacterium]|nr:hydantoinase/oxoprolinase family protein [Gammaproteobacteria bacterium]MCF6259733.1 hydantoinase/oxoprolinase family protein [Gammaproteobacteria bacterium]
MPLLGIDTGGTFTDFVLLSDESPNLRVHKVLSTPQAPEQAILQGIHELGLGDCDSLLVVHGSTVATNAVLEGKGVRTVFITNTGLRDLLTIGRQARAELYNLNPAPVTPPVPRELCLETGGRLSADGSVLETLSESDLHTLRSTLKKLKPQAVAINLLFSWIDERFEKRIAEIVPDGMFISRSSHILPEPREYERGITTWLNASVGPLVQGYLQRLCAGVPQAQVAVMQSAGGTIDATQAGEEAVHMLLSGPAGGLAGAQYVGGLAGCHRLLSFDMGGTSTDVALLDNTQSGDLPLTTEGHIGSYPVGVPMVDMHTIGAGGGSIARIDSGGLLQVGPESAGADPGPACYGRSITGINMQATVTDANLLLGRLRSDAFLGGHMTLDENAARTAIAPLAKTLNLSPEHTAQGIIDVANEHMARALRVMSVQRGVDAAQLTLTSFGGAGGLHVCALAEALEMSQALVPAHAGVLSALGMLVAPRARYLSHTLLQQLSAAPDDVLLHDMQQAVVMLTKRGREDLIKEGVDADSIRVSPSVDLRYRGQSFVINLPVVLSADSKTSTNSQTTGQAMASVIKQFHERHAALYGHSLQQPVELVTLRVKVHSPPPQALTLPSANETKSVRKTPVLAHVTLAGIGTKVPVYTRESLSSGISGPALITETISTTYLAPGWLCQPDASGCLLLSKT